mmetsp:Transcript_111208/g.309713  ORF Transcript_111208/g.309713 Transcript_111208/m.309713 type:complete len:239 (-) Transcript_111208:828-1544(-)
MRPKFLPDERKPKAFPVSNGPKVHMMPSERPKGTHAIYSGMALPPKMSASWPLHMSMGPQARSRVGGNPLPTTKPETKREKVSLLVARTTHMWPAKAPTSREAAIETMLFSVMMYVPTVTPKTNHRAQKRFVHTTSDGPMPSIIGSTHMTGAFSGTSFGMRDVPPSSTWSSLAFSGTSFGTKGDRPSSIRSLLASGSVLLPLPDCAGPAAKGKARKGARSANNTKLAQVLREGLMVSA